MLGIKRKFTPIPFSEIQNETIAAMDFLLEEVYMFLWMLHAFQPIQYLVSVFWGIEFCITLVMSEEETQLPSLLLLWNAGTLQALVLYTYISNKQLVVILQTKGGAGHGEGVVSGVANVGSSSSPIKPSVVKRKRSSSRKLSNNRPGGTGREISYLHVRWGDCHSFSARKSTAVLFKAHSTCLGLHTHELSYCLTLFDTTNLKLLPPGL